MSFGNKDFLDSVMSAIYYIQICVFRYFSDVCGFLASIGKCSAFLLGYFYL